MRNGLRTALALLMALAFSTPVLAQGGPAMGERIALNASLGPSFANLGTTFSTTAGLDVNLTDHVALTGEFGFLAHAPFSDAAEIAPPIPGAEPRRVNAYHWNGNLRVRPYESGSFSPYVTAGFGSFIADTVMDTRSFDGLSVQDRRRAADPATNLGAGLFYRLTDWVGVNADYRTFFVHRDGEDPRVHRFTTGLSLFLR